MASSMPPAVGAYAPLAPYYDAYTDHPGYSDWVIGLRDLAAAHDLGGPRTLDLACGTGKSSAPLIEAGHTVTACDLVPEMLAQAERRCGADAQLVQADIAHLPVLGEFDLITCLNDACNYLLEPAQLAGLFAGAARNLTAGGLLVFDANTTYTYRTAFAQTFCRQDDERFFVWQGQASSEFSAGEVAEARLDVFAKAHEDCWRRISSLHRQRHHPFAGIEGALAAAGLELVVRHGQDAEGRPQGQPDDDRDPKAIFLARKPR